MAKLEVRHIEKRDIPEVIKLYERVWERDFSERMKKIFYWKFFDHPLVKEGLNKSLIICKEDELIGFMGVIPANFKLGDKMAFGHWICDFMVDPNHRGVGLKLNRKILNEQPLLIGQAGTEAYKIWQAMVNKITGKKIDIARKVLIYKKMNYYYAFKKIVKAHILASGLNYLWVQYRKKKFNEGDTILGYSINRIERFDSKYDTFLKEAINSHDNIAVRDVGYLNWRFVECPYDKHHIFIAKKKEDIVGYIAIRIIEKNQKKNGLIVDVLTHKDDFSTKYFLFKSAFEYFDREKVNVVIIQDCEISSITDFLKKIGFVNQLQTETNCIIGSTLPTLGIPDEIVYNPNKWYITLGDSDFSMDY